MESCVSVSRKGVESSRIIWIGSRMKRMIGIMNFLEGVLNELLYADDLVLMSETTWVLRNKFLNWNEAFESKGSSVMATVMEFTYVGDRVSAG